MSCCFVVVPAVRQVRVFGNKMPFSLLFTTEFNLQGLADVPPFGLGAGHCEEWPTKVRAPVVWFFGAAQRRLLN